MTVPETPGARVSTPGPRRVMMVEDNRPYALGVRLLLESAGHEVEICTNGPEALARVPAFAPDVILLDLGLPGMDGYEIARRMREMRALDAVRLVVVSGYASDADQRHSQDVGVDEHLAKPLRFAELLRVVHGTGGPSPAPPAPA